MDTPPHIVRKHTDDFSVGGLKIVAEFAISYKV